MTKEDYFNAPYQTCQLCGEPKPDVREQEDPLTVERLPSGRYRLVVCNECLKQRRAEV